MMLVLIREIFKRNGETEPCCTVCHKLGCGIMGIFAKSVALGLAEFIKTFN